MKNIFLLLLLSFNVQAQQSLSVLKKARPVQINSTSLAIEQSTNLPARMRVKYGLTEAMENTLVTNDFSVSQALTLENLQPSTFYHVQVITETPEESIVGTPEIMATASAVTGDIRYYFLNGVDASFSNGAEPDGVQYPEVLAAMYDLIDNAQFTIDCAVYNTSWFELVERLEQAVERGVRVRYIHDQDTNNNALQGNIDFPLLVGSPGNGIMHNKFMVVDAESEDNAYVLTGAMNWTFGNITEDFNNTLIIRDKTLALNYTIEFEEMWGGSGDNPDAGNAKFGSDKSDNTAHFFNVGGTEFEVYFSPSDGVTAVMEDVIDNTEESLELALLLLTRQSLTTKIKDKFFQGVNVRGIFDNNETDEFEFLASQNVNVVYHFPSDMLHHKYAISDANFSDSDPTVITGSHNWTNSAETINDENTLILRDATAANLFLQEFEARWYEVGPVSDIQQIMPGSISLSPNPFRSELSLTLEAEQEERVEIRLISSAGQQLFTKPEQLTRGENQIRFTLPRLPQGIYYLQMQGEQGQTYFVEKVIKLPKD